MLNQLIGLRVKENLFASPDGSCIACEPDAFSAAEFEAEDEEAASESALISESRNPR